MIKKILILIFNINNYDSFSARPEEFINLYSEYTLDDELLQISERIKTFIKHLKCFEISEKNNPIKENENLFYFESNKTISKTFVNYFLDIEVNFLVIFFMKNKYQRYFIIIDTSF